TPNGLAMFNGVVVPAEAQLKLFYNVWGTDRTYNHTAVPWAWAFDAPSPWAKQVASHLGGTTCVKRLRPPLRHQPEVGAGCGSAARPDLSGGPPARAVP